MGQPAFELRQAVIAPEALAFHDEERRPEDAPCLGEIDLDRDALARDLDGNWEVLGEAIQTVVRAEITAGRSSIAENNQLVSSILTVVDEEMSGIAQVNEAIDQIDRLTQQNAAMVEQLAASAQSLRGQSRAVLDSMSVFRLK